MDLGGGHGEISTAVKDLQVCTSPSCSFPGMTMNAFKNPLQRASLHFGGCGAAIPEVESAPPNFSQVGAFKWSLRELRDRSFPRRRLETRCRLRVPGFRRPRVGPGNAVALPGKGLGAGAWGLELLLCSDCFFGGLGHHSVT